VSSPITIAVGESAVVVDVTTTSVSGRANVTAYTYSLSSGYASAYATIQAVTPSPATIGAAMAPAAFSPSPFQKGSNLVLQLQDVNGNPAKARVLTSLTITSSDASVFNGTLKVMIAQGSSYAIVPIVPLASGSTTFTITSPGLTTAEVQFQVLSSPFALSLLASSLSAISNENTIMTLTVTMDGVGVSSARVTWSTNLGTISPPISVTNGQGVALGTFKPTTVGLANITAVVSTSYGAPQVVSSEVIVGNSASSNQSLLGTLFSFPYVLILVGIAAAAAVLAFLIVRRRRLASEAEAAISGEESGFSYYIEGRNLGSGLR
jgi:hypothetical protein